ncbi:hypothetical protein BH10ACI3_BH10ACI3_11050 [soil metagenome]
MSINRLLIALFSAAMLLAASTVSFACACCADRGQYSVYTRALDTYQLDLLKDMHFGPVPELFLTEGDDEVQAMADLGVGELSLVDAYTNNTWKFVIKSTSGKSGTLILPRPAKMTTKKIDLHDKEDGDPSLYKEFVFDGFVRSGSGVFKRGIVSPTKYTLIFQGRGNNCDNAEDFTHWRLEVKGSKAHYSFFGKMGA